MIIKVYDRYTNEQLHLWKIDITKEQLDKIKAGFKIWIDKALTKGDILDADDE